MFCELSEISIKCRAHLYFHMARTLRFSCFGN